LAVPVGCIETPGFMIPAETARTGGFPHRKPGPAGPAPNVHGAAGRGSAAVAALGASGRRFRRRSPLPLLADLAVGTR
jgi:hypothetical protein